MVLSSERMVFQTWFRFFGMVPVRKRGRAPCPSSVTLRCHLPPTGGRLKPPHRLWRSSAQGTPYGCPKRWSQRSPLIRHLLSNCTNCEFCELFFKIVLTGRAERAIMKQMRRVSRINRENGGILGGNESAAKVKAEQCVRLFFFARPRISASKRLRSGCVCDRIEWPERKELSDRKGGNNKHTRLFARRFPSVVRAGGFFMAEKRCRLKRKTVV